MWENTSTWVPGVTATGVHPDAKATNVRHLSLRERVDLWFIEPLKRQKKDEAFIALMIMLPLIEKLVRYRLHFDDKTQLKFGDGSKALRELAKLLGPASEAEAKAFWKCFRHGMAHRAMVKSEIKYALMPGVGAKPVLTVDGRVLVYVWQLRDRIVKELEAVGAKLWKDTTCPLPEVYQELV